MLIALAQMDVKAARGADNFRKMRSLLFEAKERGAEIIAFPELCLSGYMIGDLWTDDSFCRDLERYNEKLLALSRETATTLIYGNIKIDAAKKGADGRAARYNAVYCLDKGRLHIRPKTLLPSYRVFDDKRYFAAGELAEISPVELESGFKIGLEVCEDLWWEDYGVNVTELLLKRGADIILNISASPFTEGKSRARDNRVRHLKNLLKDAFRPFFYLNSVGVQNNGKNIITFDGDSSVYNSRGERLSPALKPYEEGIILASAEASHPLLDAQERSAVEQKFDAIIRAYQGVAELLPQNSKFVFGLSGGVDSSLSCALAVLALGSERVRGYNLPTRFNSDETKASAKKLAENLKISYETLEIESLIAAAAERFPEFSTLAYENLQARVRGSVMLQSLAALVGGVVVANGNKLELALGYATLYGDTVGVFAPLGDLTKIEIWEMSRFINERFGLNSGGIIPKELIADADFECEIEPTAELKEGQRDPMWWGVDDRIIERVLSYKRVSAEEILAWYKEGVLAKELLFEEKLLKKYGGDNARVFIEHLEWFFSSLKAGVFKRVQYPPVVMLSKSSFGYDFRESMLGYTETERYGELKRELLG